MMSQHIEIIITFECEGTYHRGNKEKFSGGQWIPGDPEEIDNFKVYLVRFSKREAGDDFNQRLDITEWLSKDEYEELYDAFCETERDNT